MTDAIAHARAAQYPHLNAEYFAFYAGRNSVDFGGECEFTEPALVAQWKRGRRQALAENRLNDDTEWD